jgi:hypothetical protein
VKGFALYTSGVWVKITTQKGKVLPTKKLQRRNLMGCKPNSDSKHTATNTRSKTRYSTPLRACAALGS